MPNKIVAFRIDRDEHEYILRAYVMGEFKLERFPNGDYFSGGLTRFDKDDCHNTACSALGYNVRQFGRWYVDSKAVPTTN